MILKTLTVGSMEVNCYILACERTKECVLVDPGDDPEDVLDAVKEDGLRVVEIVATHGHFDHIGYTREIQQALKVPFSLHREDLHLLESSQDIAAFFGVRVGPPPEVNRFLSEGDEIRFGDESLLVRHTPGHSPGGIALLREGLVFVGDSLFAGSIGRTDMPGQSHETLMSSIREKLLSLDDATEVYPGHGPSTTIGEERKHNPHLKT